MHRLGITRLTSDFCRLSSGREIHQHPRTNASGRLQRGGRARARARRGAVPPGATARPPGPARGVGEAGVRGFVRGVPHAVRDRPAGRHAAGDRAAILREFRASGGGAAAPCEDDGDQRNDRRALDEADGPGAELDSFRHCAASFVSASGKTRIMVRAPSTRYRRNCAYPVIHHFMVRSLSPSTS